MEPACIVEGCLKPQKRNQMCWAHDEASRTEKHGPCSVPSCGKNAARAGMCNVHYRRDIQSKKPPCAVENCGRPIVSGDLCDAHRLRLQHHGHLGFTRPEDWGSKTKHPLFNSWLWWRRVGVCDEWLEFWEFVSSVGGRPTPLHALRRLDDSKPIGPGNWVWKERVASSLDAKEYAKAWHRANKRQSKSQSLRKSYGISIDDYERMEAEQNHVCAICSKKERNVDRNTQMPRRLAVDHDHSTGKVRGLLCGDCNKGLGHFYDSPELLELAIAYVRKHTESAT